MSKPSRIIFALTALMLFATSVIGALQDTERSFKEIVVLRGFNYQEFFVRT